MTDTVIVVEESPPVLVVVGYGVANPPIPPSEALLIWERITTDKVVVTQYAALDVFPSADNKVVTLPNPSSFTDGRVDVWNQSSSDFNVIVKNHLGVVLKTIQASNAYSFYYTPSVAAWEQVHLSGELITELAAATYGDFNSLAWDALPSGKYTMTDVGDVFSGLHPDCELLTASQYTFTIVHNNVSANYSDQIWFGTNSDFSNNFLGRPCIRSGYDFGSSTSVGWKAIGYKAEQTYSLDAQKRSTIAVSIPTTDNVIFVWDNKVSEFGAGGYGYDTSTGVFTCPFTGAYTFTFRFNTSANSGTHSMFAGAEIWNGAAWVASEFSCVVDTVRAGDYKQVVFVSPVRFVKGTQVRFVFWCDSSISIINYRPTSTTRFTIPAARLMILGTESQ